MTRKLRERALARAALTAAEVAEVYAKTRSRRLLELCESHERLRLDLEGAEGLLDYLYRKVVEVAAELEAADDADARARCLTRLRQLVVPPQGHEGGATDGE